jgi:putative transposase
VREKFQLSIRSACQLLGLQQSTFFYKPRRTRDDEPLKAKIREVIEKHQDHGRPMLVWRLRERHGVTDNHKRIYRLYKELGLQIGKRSRKRRKSERRFMFLAPTRPNELWAMDFVSDSFDNGRKFRVLTVKDLFTHEALVLYVDRSITGVRVAEVLSQVIARRGKPRAIICDNGTEYTSRAMDEWAHASGVDLQFIQPGKPIQNAFIESFNGKFRASCLNFNSFKDLAEARAIVEAWRINYNFDRPNKPLGKLTPAEFAKKHGVVVEAV